MKPITSFLQSPQYVALTHLNPRDKYGKNAQHLLQIVRTNEGAHHSINGVGPSNLFQSRRRIFNIFSALQTGLSENEIEVFEPCRRLEYEISKGNFCLGTCPKRNSRGEIWNFFKGRGHMRQREQAVVQAGGTTAPKKGDYFIQTIPGHVRHWNAAG